MLSAGHGWSSRRGRVCDRVLKGAALGARCIGWDEDERPLGPPPLRGGLSRLRLKILNLERHDGVSVETISIASVTFGSLLSRQVRFTSGERRGKESKGKRPQAHQNAGALGARESSEGCKSRYILEVHSPPNAQSFALPSQRLSFTTLRVQLRGCAQRCMQSYRQKEVGARSLWQVAETCREGLITLAGSYSGASVRVDCCKSGNNVRKTGLPSQ